MRARIGFLGFPVLTVILTWLVLPSCSDQPCDRNSDSGCSQAVDHDQSPEGVVIGEDANSLTLKKDGLSFVVWKQPFGWQLSATSKVAVAQSDNFQTAESFFYIRDGQTFALGQYRSWERITDGAVLAYRTSEDIDAFIGVSFQTGKTIRVNAGLSQTSGSLQLGQDVRLFPGEAIYGLMERINSDTQISEIDPQEIGSINRRGEIASMTLLPTVGVYTPFYQSSNGYGLYVDSTFPGEFDAGNIVANRLRFTFATTQGRSPALSYCLFYGPTHDGVLKEYTALTGRPFIPPLWAFKHLRWRDELAYGTAELDGHKINVQVAEDVSNYEGLGIPAGNYLFDRPWTAGQEGFAEFDWDPLRFPNTDAMLQSLSLRGCRVITWGGPWAIGNRPWQNGYEATQGSYYAPDSNRYIDFTNPAAYEWWKTKVKRFVLEKNVHGWKLDRADEDHPSLPSQRYHNGLTGLEMHNAYCLYYQRCFFDAMQEAWGDDFFNEVRAGWSGSQRYGILWGGDTRGAVGTFYCRSTDLGLRSVIIAQLNAAFMGFPIWGSDTGGYHEFRDREVFARWLAFSAFSPLMEIGGVGAHAPWNMPTDPHYDSEMIAIYRTYTKLHHDLATYIHNYAVKSGQDGRAVVRALVFMHPNDPVVRSMWDEYYLGEDILVAPVWQVGVRERQVYIPAGDFVDYWNPGATISGPRTITAPAPLDRIPVYVRQGANILGRVW